MGTFLGGLFIGAGLVYFFNSGRGGQGVAAPVMGKVGSMFGFNPPDNPNPDDQTLKDRVQSEAFRGRNMQKEDVVVNVVNGIVELRGELATPEEIDGLIREVKNVPGVRGVESYLHLPNTPAPNKESALHVS
jgi:hypothetical protein